MKKTEQYVVTSRLRIILFYAYLVAIGVLALFVTKVVVDNNRIAAEAHRGLCTLQAERRTRLESTQKILDHPDEVDNAKIIATFGKPLLVRSAATAKADLDALKDVSC